MEATDNKTSPKSVRFAAIDPVIERLIPTAKEAKQPSRDWLKWGERNDYPLYIKGLCRDVPTLRSIILGCTDYVCGDSVSSLHETMNRRGDTPREIVKAIARNIWQLGGAYLLITLSNDRTRVAEVEVLPTERIRTNEDADVYWYSEDWKKSTVKTLVYPKWQKGTQEVQSVLPIKVWGEGAYSEPIFAASVKACETERSIDEYHLGNIERGFMGSYIINFNNGVPDDNIKEEIAKDFEQKFGGSQNAGRIMFSWNPNKDAMTTLQKMEVSDYGDKYETLSSHCRQQIFTAFRANANLFGIPSASGFSNEEYTESFKLFNRTMIQPVQTAIAEALAKVDFAVDIVPFSIERATTTIDEEGA